MLAKQFVPRGFTLIELLVAVAISLILAWQGLVRYQSFSRQQQVKQSALSFISSLKVAQQKAISGKKPAAGCNKLDGYEVSIGVGSNQYEVKTRCDGGVVATEDLVLPTAQVEFISGGDVLFLPLYGTTNTTVEYRLQHLASGVTPAVVRVQPAGTIECDICD